MTSAAPAILEAVLERITYANQDTGYTVARVVTNRSSDQLTLVGPLLGAQPGESLHLQGQASCSWSHVGYATGNHIRRLIRHVWTQCRWVDQSSRRP
jgi:hypothetical protein